MTKPVRELLRGTPESTAESLDAPGFRYPLLCCAVIVMGCSLYGFTVGLWRAPLQSVYTAIKFPLLIFLTCAGNALLNGMLAQVLGSRLSFRQTSLAILTSFATAAVILGALSPIALFVVYNTPPLLSVTASTGHSVMMVTHVCLIAYAGVVANQRLLRLLTQLSGSHSTARRVLLSWLAGNLLLGSQLAYTIRPFIGNPAFPVQFLRADPLRGNFYETLGRALSQLLQ